jgi:hypothetical protein
MSKKDFHCWVLDVFLWENPEGGTAGLFCIPWVYRSTREPRMILRRSLGSVDKAGPVVAKLHAPHSTDAFVVIGAEEEWP